MKKGYELNQDAFIKYLIGDEEGAVETTDPEPDEANGVVSYKFYLTMSKVKTEGKELVIDFDIKGEKSSNSGVNIIIIVVVVVVVLAAGVVATIVIIKKRGGGRGGHKKGGKSAPKVSSYDDYYV